MSALKRREFLQKMGTAAGGLILSSCGGGAGSAILSPSPAPLGMTSFAGAISVGEPELVGANVPSFHFPHFVKNPADGLIYAYFIDHTLFSENDVGLATSPDGLNFDYVGKVLYKGPEWFDFYQASFPSVQIFNGTWYMLYEGKDIHSDLNSVLLAISDDGVRWNKQGQVIRPDSQDSAEFSGDVPHPGLLGNADVGTPTFFYERGVWNVYFHMTGQTQDRWNVRIGYAYGHNLKSLNVSRTPLIDLQPEGYGAGTVGTRSNVIKRGGWYYMMYELSTEAGPLNGFTDSYWGTGVARSRNPGYGWEVWDGNPLISNPEPGFGYDGPELLEHDGKLWLYYRVRATPTTNSTFRVEVLGL